MWWIIGIVVIIVILFLVIRSKSGSKTKSIPLEDIPSENPCDLDNAQISKLIDRFYVDDLKERIDAIMESARIDHPVMLEELMKNATGALSGEIRVAAAIAFCENPSQKRITFIEEYLNRTSSGQAAFGGDRKATAVLILAAVNGSMDLGQVLRSDFDGKDGVLKYYEKTETPYKSIKNNVDQLGYLLAWCAAIDMGTGRKELINYLKGKVRRSKALIDSVLKVM